MIFYKAIKYTILDYCIEKLFNQISKNLLSPNNRFEVGLPLNLEDLEEGLTVSRIVVQTNTNYRFGDYRNCTIYGLRFDAQGDIKQLDFSYEVKDSVEMEHYSFLLRNEISIYS